MTHAEIVSFIWGVADLIRDTFKRGKYQDVILPLTVLRRLDCVLTPTRKKVLETNAKFKGKLENVDPQLRRASGFAFWNTSKYDFGSLLDDHSHLKANLRNYIQGFSPNMRETLEKFDFDNTIAKLDEAGLLFKVVERFGQIDLHPSRVSNPLMGTIFEELIRKFNEALNENPGEHFTPRDVVHLMVDLLLADDEKRVGKLGVVLKIYDPCAGSGGMLTITKDHITGALDREGLNPKADVRLYGQEVNPETFAICKSDLFMKSADGRDADNIAYGSVLSKDAHAGQTFEYLITNPPYGKDWKRDLEAVQAEHERGDSGRFGAGLPRISDGQLLFLQHMLAHMTPFEKGGSRVAMIMNGSPLFSGDAGSGESEIRRWVLENDWLEAIVALPEQLFYNTGIATYVWVLTNRKVPKRLGKVTMIDATSFWTPMRKSLGDKRREIPHDKGVEILRLLRCSAGSSDAASLSDFVRVYQTTHFGYRKITVERPLRMNFQVSVERISRLDQQSAFRNLSTSKKKGKASESEVAAGAKQQDNIRAVLRSMPGTLYKDREAFALALDEHLDAADLALSAPLMKATFAALGERDETAEICRDKSGNPEPDPELRDYESVPLSERVEDYFAREVTPYVPDAWINTAIRDDKDGQVGRVGYEINFNRYFYKYVPPRPLEQIQAEIRQVEQEILKLLGEVAL